jgi:GDPmannose 4,6-dehydratase
MHMMLLHDEPLDLVIGTGESYSVREFLDVAFGYAGLDWNDHVEIDPRFYRPAEVDYLQSDPAKAKATIGWEPQITFKELVEEMVRADLDAHGLSV